MLRWVCLVWVVAVPGVALAQTPVVIDMAKESFAASDQAFGRLMNTALAVATSPSFSAGAFVIGNPGGATDMPVVVEGVASFSFLEDLTPLKLKLGAHAGTQILTTPRPATHTLMGNRPFTFPRGSLAFTTSNSYNGMNFFAGLSLFSEDGDSYVVGGAMYALEFEEVSGRGSPYLFTNIEIIDQLSSFFLAGLSASEEDTFSRLGGGIQYRFTGLLPGMGHDYKSDIEVGGLLGSMRQVLATQNLMLVMVNWYPYSLSPEASESQQQEMESALRLQLGRLVTAYDYIEEEGGLFAKVEAQIGWFSAGLNFLPANRVIDEASETPPAEWGGRHVGWQLAAHAGRIGYVSVQSNYLLSTSFAAPMVGTTFALVWNVGSAFSED